MPIIKEVARKRNKKSIYGICVFKQKFKGDK